MWKLRKAKILIVEDEFQILKGLMFNLEYAGHEVNGVQSAEEALTRFQKSDVDILLVDIELPHMDGFEFIKKVREIDEKVYIIVCSGRVAEMDILRGFYEGADDYVQKPFNISELLARINVGMKRLGKKEIAKDSGENNSMVLKFKDFLLDFNEGTVIKGEVTERLFPSEEKILKYLIENQGLVISRTVILDRLWEGAYDITSRTIDNHIRNIRKKLEPDPQNPRYIMTVRGKGYKFEKNQN